MMYFKASFLLAVFLPSTVSAEGGATFSYDPSKSNGPESWATLDLGDKVNVCGGEAQSGIDVLTGLCDETDADYIFEVREGLIVVVFSVCVRRCISRLWWRHRVATEWLRRYSIRSH